jgi:microcystin-dependent protein
MRRILLALLAFAVLAGGGFLALTSFATGPAVARWAPCPRNWAWIPAWQPRASPLRDTRFTIPGSGEGGHGRICYGAPSLRGRTMIGGGAVPYGQLWRTGANEPTTLHTDVPTTLGGIALAPGSYAIYTVPGPDSWQVIVNRSTRQWGLESEYSAEITRQEVGRFAVAPETLGAPVEQLRIAAEPVASGAEILLEWQRTRLRLPLRSPAP